MSWRHPISGPRQYLRILGNNRDGHYRDGAPALSSEFNFFVANFARRAPLSVIWANICVTTKRPVSVSAFRSSLECDVTVDTSVYPKPRLRVPGICGAEARNTLRTLHEPGQIHSVRRLQRDLWPCVYEGSI